MMKKISLKSLAAAVSLCALAGVAPTALAQDAALKVDDVWVRATVPSQHATGAFMRLTSAVPGRLVAVESDAAKHVEVHEMAMQDNVMKMRQVPGIDLPEAARQDISRLHAIWRDTRAEFGQGGPFLFGAFSIADAFFAPVVSRFTTYGIAAAGPVRDYMDAVLALPAMQEWMRDARAEATFVPEDEPYRKHR